MNKELKEKLTDKIWYGLCYADGVPIKDLYTYAEILTNNILGFLKENKLLKEVKNETSNDDY